MSTWRNSPVESRRIPRPSSPFISPGRRKSLTAESPRNPSIDVPSSGQPLHSESSSLRSLARIAASASGDIHDPRRSAGIRRTPGITGAGSRKSPFHGAAPTPAIIRPRVPFAPPRPATTQNSPLRRSQRSILRERRDPLGIRAERNSIIIQPLSSLMRKKTPSGAFPGPEA